MISCHNALKVTDIMILENYPSGSAMVSVDDRIFLVGDDASYICVIDKNFKVIDTIQLLEKTETRIPKPLKHDLEAATLVYVNKQPYILLLGSGSLTPYRNTLALVDVKNKTKEILDVKPFYDRLTEAGIEQINIEGAATYPGGLILVNRGNKSYRKNHLIFVSDNFWNDQQNAGIHLMSVGVNEDSAVFNGVSGLEYSKQSDKLLLTVSTEETYNTYGDGTIGKSYLWIINDMSTKKGRAAINADRIIDLEKAEEKFKSQKIESVCIIQEDKKKFLLALVADNDDGKSVLFKLTLAK